MIHLYTGGILIIFLLLAAVSPQKAEGPIPGQSITVNIHKLLHNTEVYDSHSMHINTLSSFFSSQLAICNINSYQILTRCVCETQCPQSWPIPMKAKITRTNILIPVERFCHKKWQCAIWKLVSYPKEVMTNVIFLKNWSNANVKRL